MQRSLAAVLAADVAGYSRLMGENTEATLAALRRLRSEVFGPAVASRRGRVVKNMGDGWIVLFDAANDAAICALQIQNRLAEDKVQEDPRMMLRLGVHLGDVIEDEEDIFGDGVNIAARLEEMTTPGSIAISDAVFGSLDGTLRPSFDDAGERMLKNIAQPVRVWTRGAFQAAPLAGARADRPQVLIRPISSSDDRAEVLELAEALTGDLVTYLGATHWLSVGTRVAPSQAYVLTSRLRANGPNLRLEARFTAPGGAELWSAKIDGTLDAAFDWQDTTAEELVAQSLAAIFDGERRKLDKLDLAEMSATQCELRGQLAIDQLDPASFAAALHYASAGIAKDPTAADPLSLALVCYLSAAGMGYDDLRAPYRQEVPKWCAAAAELAPDHPLLHLALGVTTYATSRDPVALRSIIERALRQSSSDFETLTLSGWAYIWIGDSAAAVECLNRALKLGRQSPWALSMKGGLALAHLQAGADAQAIEQARAGLEISAGYATLHRVLAAAHGHLGETDAARAALDAARRYNPDETISDVAARNVFADSAGARRYLEGLRLAGMAE